MSDQADPAPLKPMAKAWRFLRLLSRPALARKLGTLATEGYLAQSGWVLSVTAGKVVDRWGESQPWTTIPFIDFLERRLRPEWSVFEYGAGASTRYFAARVATVTAVEHDAAFAGALVPLLPTNAKLLVRAGSTEEYACAIREAAVPPEIVVIDGIERVACVSAVLGVLAPRSILVLDDSERSDYFPARTLLKAAGFRELDFWGLAPGRVERKCTSVFYRDANVLGL